MESLDDSRAAVADGSVAALTTSRPPYRGDVDGLRAIAVLLVVAFHALPTRLSGGFIGVDVFFVISGYLISGILLADLRDGRASLRAFYAGRVRRILPAMLVVILCCLAFGWVVLWPDEYQTLGRDAGAAAASMANLLLLRDRGYFDASATLQPLLHLWSLSVEEQFYLAWPLLLGVMWRRQLATRRVVAVLLGASLVLNVVIVGSRPQWAFYLPFTRAWELMLGALLALPGALPLDDASRRTRDVLATLGLLAIALSAVGLHEGLAFPGWWALAPCLGAVALMLAGPDAWLSRRVLRHASAVFIGRISYPIYLWHWPLLAFGRVVTNGPLPESTSVLLGVASVPLAWLTYVALERPIRFGPHTPRRLALVLLATVGTGAAGLAVRLGHGLPARHAQFAEVTAELDRRDTPVTAPACPTPLAELNDCAIARPAAAPTVALVGDSHARRLFFGLAPALAAHGENLVVLTCNGCPPFAGVARSDLGVAATAARTARAMEVVLATPGIHTVVIAARGPVYLTGQGFGAPDQRPPFHLVDVAEPTRTDASAIFAAGMARTLTRLTRAGKRVVFVVALPELGFDPRACFALPLRPRRDPCAVSTDAYGARSAAYRALVARVLADFPTVRVVTPSELLCDRVRCIAQQDGHSLFSDHTHLSTRGSALVAGLVVSAVVAPAGAPPR